MAHDPKRRQAFAQAFKDYPAYLMMFVSNHCQLVDPKGEEPPPMMTVAYRNSIAQICFAQFLTRLIRTRCNDENNAQLVGFGFETANRYLDFKNKLIGHYEIIADDKYRRAINQIEQEMSNLVLTALAEEAAIDIVAKDKGDFDEIHFWEDVLNSFKLVQRQDHPIWGVALRAVALPHMAEFRRALEAGNNALQ